MIGDNKYKNKYVRTNQKCVCENIKIDFIISLIDSAYFMLKYISGRL